QCATAEARSGPDLLNAAVSFFRLIERSVVSRNNRNLSTVDAKTQERIEHFLIPAHDLTAKAHGHFRDRASHWPAFMNEAGKVSGSKYDQRSPVIDGAGQCACESGEPAFEIVSVSEEMNQVTLPCIP